MSKTVKIFSITSFILIILLAYYLVNGKLSNKCGAYNYSYNHTDPRLKDPMESCSNETFCHVVQDKNNNNKPFSPEKSYSPALCKPFYNYIPSYILPDFISP